MAPRALAQWRGLHRTLVDLGVRVELVEPRADVPDMTFAANAGVVVRAVASSRPTSASASARPSSPTSSSGSRRGATRSTRSTTRTTGRARATCWRRRASPRWCFAGYRFRTEESALDHLDAELGVRTVRLELTDPRYYHLDTCLCPLGGGRALVVADALSPASRRALARGVRRPHRGDAGGRGALRVQRARRRRARVVLNAGCEATEQALRERGLTPVPTPTDEFSEVGRQREVPGPAAGCLCLSQFRAATAQRRSIRPKIIS